MPTLNNINIETIREIASISDSRICGFILYRTTDAEVIKVMCDSDYLRSIDERSGMRWPIFAVKPLKPSRLEIKGGSTPGYTSMIITEEVDPKENLPIIDFFGLDSTSDTPCFVLFCWDDNGELLVTHYKLTIGSVETAYNSIVEVIDKVTQSEAAILPELRREMGVYREARESIEALKFRKRFVKSSAYGNKILSTLSSIVTLGSI